ncbi:MAG: peptidoglycan DD-metalloendopeptidase family protein [Acidimicrobiales bacterium]
MPRALLVLCCTALCSTSLAVPAAAAPDPPTHVPPVDAPVQDPFRPPVTRFGPGNRGLEYATAPGTEVRATGDGRVTFAGSVAGALHVTVVHDDGVRTTYSFLARVDVLVGQPVRQGAVVGVTLDDLHLGARRGDGYFDPATLFDPSPPQVHLVPFDEPPGAGESGERSAINQIIGGIGGVLEHADGVVGSVTDWLQEGGTQLVRTLEHYASRFTFPTAVIDAALTGLGAWQRARRASSRPCSADGVPPPPAGRRIAVLVAGLGSDSDSSTIDQVDTVGLGYEVPDVLRFSYAGGRVPDATDGLSSITATAYGAPETQTDLRAAGARLADLVEAVVAEAPGVTIDLLAYSQGGVVVRLALLELERRHGSRWLGRLGLVATLGTPHGGADIATGVHAASSTETGQAVLDVYSYVTDQELDHDAVSVRQLGETSEVMATLADHPVPDTVTAISIAARGDIIVPVPRSAAPGMEEVVVPITGRDAHRELPGSSQATRELGLALAGLPPGCQAFHEALLDQGVGEGISVLEDMAGAAVTGIAAFADVRGP